jgi:hypothetical protein
VAVLLWAGTFQFCTLNVDGISPAPPGARRGGGGLAGGSVRRSDGGVAAAWRSGGGGGLAAGRGGLTGHVLGGNFSEFI